VLVADDFVKVPRLGGDYQRRTNFSIGKGMAVCGTRPDLKVGKQSVLPVLVLQAPASRRCQVPLAVLVVIDHRIIKVGKDLSDHQVQPSPQPHPAC